MTSESGGLTRMWRSGRSWTAIAGLLVTAASVLVAYPTPAQAAPIPLWRDAI